MAEFFIARHYRRRGIGTQTAHEIWQRFPGAWQIRVMHGNDAARRFWVHAVTAFVGDAFNSSRFEKEGKDWLLLSFVSPARSALSQSEP